MKKIDSRANYYERADFSPMIASSKGERMDAQRTSDSATVSDLARAIHERLGTRALSNEEVLVLAADALSHTFTREEIGFGESIAG